MTHPTEAKSPPTQPTGKNQKLAMQILREMYAEGDNVQHVSVLAWGERFKDQSNVKNPRDAWSEVKIAAFNNDWCVIDGLYAYPPSRAKQ